MKYSVSTNPLTAHDVLIIGMFEKQIPKNLDSKLKDKISELIKRDVFKGEKSSSYSLDGDKLIVLVGLGKEETSTLDILRTAAANGANTARSLGVEKIATNLSSISLPKTSALERAEVALHNVRLKV